MSLFTLVLTALHPLSLHAQDQTVSGNLGVGGILDVNGDYFNLGTSTYDTTKYGFSVGYAEDSTSHAATLTLTATRPAATWVWQQAAATNGSGSMKKMLLSAGNALTLYDQTTPTPVAAIVLDPVNTSTFNTSTIFKGTDNEMPNQRNLGSNSVLTVGLADARYLTANSVSSDVNIGLGSSATSTLSTALGCYANASGYGSSALGIYSIGSGLGSTAVGSSASATNSFAVALGNSSVAGGVGSLALGQNTTAAGDQSVAVSFGSHATATQASAFGEGSVASGYASLALGAQSTASGYASSTLGPSSTATNSYSIALGQSSSASGFQALALGDDSLASADEAVTLGTASAATTWASQSLGYHSAATGSSSMALGSYSMASGSDSTALGNSSVASGDFSVAAGVGAATSIYQAMVGAYGLPGGNAHTWVATDALFTVGNGQSAANPHNAFSVSKNGDTSVAGALTVASKIVASGPIIVQPQGDLSMGEFTAQPSPTP